MDSARHNPACVGLALLQRPVRTNGDAARAPRVASRERRQQPYSSMRRPSTAAAMTRIVSMMPMATARKVPRVWRVAWARLVFWAGTDGAGGRRTLERCCVYVGARRGLVERGVA